MRAQHRCWSISIMNQLLEVLIVPVLVQVFNLSNPRTPYKDIESPLKFQTRCVTCFPDSTGYLVRNTVQRLFRLECIMLHLACVTLTGWPLPFVSAARELCPDISKTSQILQGITAYAPICAHAHALCSIYVLPKEQSCRERGWMVSGLVLGAGGLHRRARRGAPC